MMRIFDWMTTGTLIGAAVIGGVFFAFSAFVMQGLARLPQGQGVAAMQAINVTAVTRWFMGLLFGTAILCVILGAKALTSWEDPGSQLLLAGCVIYIVGAVIVTVAFNVPLNDALAGVVPEAAEAAPLWTRYLKDWTVYNHVRTLLSVVACVLLLLSQRASGQDPLPLESSALDSSALESSVAAEHCADPCPASPSL